MEGPQPDLAGELAELRKAVQGLESAVQQLVQQMGRPALHVSVEQMEVERLGFFIPAIDVETISGELNIGVTHMIKAGEAAGKQSEQQPESDSGGDGPGAEGPAPEETVLWPAPPPEEELGK